MERKLGSTFNDNKHPGVMLKVVLEGTLNLGCGGCFYDRGKQCANDFDDSGRCGSNYRADKTGVIFQKISEK